MDLDADGQIDTCTRFIYDGNQIVMQFDRAIAPSDDSADPLTIDHLWHRYLWNPAAVDQLMADEQVTDPTVAGDIVWPLGDHQGTIRDLAAYDPAIDATTVVNHRTFDAYGNLQSQTATNSAHDTLFAFTGRPLDQTTCLQNNLHRWYDPAVGGWMSEDPIGFEGRDGNLSAYVGNGPVNAVDPTGWNRWLMFHYGHLFILVEVWDHSGQYVTGYAQLHFSICGHEIVRGFPTGATIYSSWSSNAEQDTALLGAYEHLIRIEGGQWWPGVYTPLLNNCWFDAMYWIRYGGEGNPVKPPDRIRYPYGELTDSPREPWVEPPPKKIWDPRPEWMR